MSQPTPRLVRDTDGIAHVRAPDLATALFGQGYAAAQDRLVQMELDRRKAAGRLSELLGPGAVGTDAFHLRAGIADAARRDLGALGDEAGSALDAYAAGVNAWLAHLGTDLPHPLGALGALDPWEPWHSIAVYKVRHLLMGTMEVKTWRTGLVRTLGPERASKLWPTLMEPPIIPPTEALAMARELATDVAPVAAALADLGQSVGGGDAASNNLVLGPSRTTTGAPILAGDPHRAIDVPNVYWQNHLTCPELDVIGLSFPGVPGFPHFGHNATAAWCITHGMADDQDVYVERLRRVDGGVEALGPDGWQRADVTVEKIEPADSDPVEVEVIETARGQVVLGDADSGVGLALRWTATAAPDTTFDCLVPMMRAATVAELDASVSRWVVPVNNVLMADTNGAIAYRMRGRLARRTSPANGWTAVPAWSNDHGWDGFVDDADLPRVVDPEHGVLVTANQRQSPDGPYVSNDFAHPSRSARIHQRLSERDTWDPADISSVLGDTVSLVAPDFVSGLTSVPARHPVEVAAQEALRSWDGRMDPDSAGAAIYAQCRMELLRVVVAGLGLDRDKVAGAGPSLMQTSRFLWSRSASFTAGLTDFDLAGVGGWAGAWASSLRWGVRSLESRFGPRPAQWRWGHLHQSRWAHPLAALAPHLVAEGDLPPVVEVGGDAECVRASGVAPPDLGAVTASVARYVFDLSDWDRSGWVVPHGVTGDPTSPHFSDQLTDWASDPVRLRPMRYSEATVDAATESTEDLPTIEGA